MIRLLVVDDSALMRRILGDIFRREADFLVAMASDGVEALGKAQEFRPDVMTLDIHMPNMDGLTCLRRVMAERPCAVVMLSSATREGADETLAALSLGAFDFVPKPGGAMADEVEDFAPTLLDVVRRAARTRLRGRRGAQGPARAAPLRLAPVRKIATLEPAMAGEPHGLVLVGASTGGPPALDALLTPLPAHFPWPILVAQHMPAAFTAALARRLDSVCALQVVEVAAPMPLLAGHVYIGRGGADLVVAARPGGYVAMNAPASPKHLWHPSVDRLVESATRQIAPERLVAVLLTGMGDDGARSMHALRAMGGHTIAEAEETAVVWGMPGALARLGGACEITPLHDVAGSVAAAVAARTKALRGRGSEAP